MAISRDEARRILKKRMTPQQIGDALGDTRGPAPYQPSRKRNYGARRCESKKLNRTFASKGERGLADRLWTRQQAGEISDLKCQARVTLLPGLTMVVDFRYVEDGAVVWHEYKGFADQRWRMQVAVWQQIGPGEYRVTMQRGPDKVIRPKPCEALLARIKELTHER